MASPLMLSSGRSERVGWKLLSTLSGVGGAVVTRAVLQKLWAAFSSSDLEPPLNPADRRIPWPVALQWAVAAGIGAGIARVLGQRAAATGWESVTGSAPPGIRT